MCKGQILEDYIKSRNGEGEDFSVIAYVGRQFSKYSFIINLKFGGGRGRVNYHATFLFISFPGDGGNDFCPILRLSEENGLAFPRKGYALVKHIKKHEKNDIKIKANIHEWDTLETITNAIAAFLL